MPFITDKRAKQLGVKPVRSNFALMRQLLASRNAILLNGQDSVKPIKGTEGAPLTSKLRLH